MDDARELLSINGVDKNEIGGKQLGPHKTGEEMDEQELPKELERALDILAEQVARAAGNKAREVERLLCKTSEQMQQVMRDIGPHNAGSVTAMVLDPKKSAMDVARFIAELIDGEEEQTAAQTGDKTMAENENKNPKKEIPLTIERGGDKLIVPKNMALKDVRKWVERQEAEEERVVGVMEQIDAYTLDGVLAFTRALKEKFGWADMIPTPGFWGDRPPVMIGIEVGPGHTIQVPWGRFQIPGVEGWLQTVVAKKDGRFIFQLGGEVKYKHREAIADLAELTRRLARDNSIYKAQAVRVTFVKPEDEEEAADPVQNAPRFMDLSTVDERELVFPDSTMKLLETNLFTPVVATEQCRRYKVPLKRGILLSGPYGVGKTLTASVLAKKCVASGWTFILIKNVKELAPAIAFASQYQPACIFAEDIDQTLGTDDRDERVNEVLNTIDGAETKGKEIMVVLTTNHVEKLNKAMLRPGRLDAVIQLTPPDAHAAEKLIRLYGRDLVSATEDLTNAGRRLAGQIPAVIREVVERSKLAAIGRAHGYGGAFRGGVLQLEGRDIETAADGMVRHLELLNEKKVAELSEREKAAQLLGESLGATFERVVAEAGRRARDTEQPSNHRAEPALELPPGHDLVLDTSSEERRGYYP